MKSDIKPFEICPNIYFVGSTRVSVHIVKTKEGLVMIDTGYPDMLEQILDSMKKLELNPKDICAIFHSHGHIDHIGCTESLKELSGAKTYISRIDNDIVNGTYDLSWAKELGLERLPFFNCDVLVEDNDVFEFGDVKIKCLLTPGHTDGVLSFFIDVNGQIAAMHGGIGMNSMAADFLNAYGLSFDCRVKFRDGIKRLRKEKVDFVLGNHPQQNDTEGILKRIQAGEENKPNPESWQKFLDDAEIKINNLMEKERC